MSGRQERGGHTRAHIVETATGLFTAHGYDQVSVEAILRETGLSKGALYHHFAGKEAVFAAVLEEAEQRIVARLTEAAADVTSPQEALRRGVRAWLSLAAADETVRRVVLLDAPSAVGWQAWRAMSDRYTLGLIRTVLTAASAMGELAADRVDLVAHMLMAMLVEAALVIAASPDDAALAARAQGAAMDAIGGWLKPV